MANYIIYIAAGAILLLFALIGLVKGFARQLFGLFAGVAALVGAFFAFKPVYHLLADNLAFINSFRDIIANFLSSLNLIVDFLGKLGTTTLNLANYTIYAIIYLLLVIIIALLYKLIRAIAIKISSTGFLRVLDKILGLVFGAAIGAVVVTLALSVVYYILMRPVFPFAPAIESFMNSAASDGNLVIKYVYQTFMEGILGPYVESSLLLGDFFKVMQTWKFN